MKRLRFATWLPLYTALAILAAAPRVLLASDNDEAARSQAATLLRTTAHRYAGLASFQVKVRMEAPITPGVPQVALWPRYQGAFPAGTLASGTYVHEHEWRIRRGQAIRYRRAGLGQKGYCRSYLPDGVFHRCYDQRQDSLPGPPRPWVVQARSADGAWTFEAPPEVGGGGLDLPTKLFYASRPEAVLTAKRSEYLGLRAAGERPCHVLRLTVGHSALRTVSLNLKRWKFRSGVWTLWIDRESSLVERAKVHEEWVRPPVEPGEETKVAVLDLREIYTNQRLNPELTRADFQPEPPDPVAPAPPEKDGVPPSKNRESKP